MDADAVVQLEPGVNGFLDVAKTREVTMRCHRAAAIPPLCLPYISPAPPVYLPISRLQAEAAAFVAAHAAALDAVLAANEEFTQARRDTREIMGAIGEI